MVAARNLRQLVSLVGLPVDGKTECRETAWLTIYLKTGLEGKGKVLLKACQTTLFFFFFLAFWDFDTLEGMNWRVS